MVLVDTSACIEWLTGTPTAATIAPLLPEPEEWLVPTMVQLELAKWLGRELDEERETRVLAFIETCVIAPLDSALAISAADHCRTHRLATADAVIYATARAWNAELLTCDAHFEGLPGVVCVPKAQPVR